MINHLNLIELIFLKIEQKFKKIILSVFELFLSFSNKYRDFLKNILNFCLKEKFMRLNREIDGNAGLPIWFWRRVPSEEDGVFLYFLKKKINWKEKKSTDELFIKYWNGNESKRHILPPTALRAAKMRKNGETQQIESNFYFPI